MFKENTVKLLEQSLYRYPYPTCQLLPFFPTRSSDKLYGIRSHLIQNLDDDDAESGKVYNLLGNVQWTDKLVTRFRKAAVQWQATEHSGETNTKYWTKTCIFINILRCLFTFYQMCVFFFFSIYNRTSSALCWRPHIRYRPNTPFLNSNLQFVGRFTVNQHHEQLQRRAPTFSYSSWYETPSENASSIARSMRLCSSPMVSGRTLLICVRGGNGILKHETMGICWISGFRKKNFWI